MSTEKSNGGPFVTFREECEILRARVAELEAQLAEREGLVCGDCDGSGWLENREEGRYPCTCMTEAEPYQILEMQLAETEALEIAHGERIEKLTKLLLLAKEGLKRCITLGFGTDCEMYAKEAHDAIIEALALQPDDSALKAWLGEPVAWKHDDPNRHDAITDTVKELLQQVNAEYMHRPIDKTEHYTIPLYSPKGLK